MNGSSSRAGMPPRLTRSAVMPLLIACGTLASLSACHSRACSQLTCSDGLVIELRPPLRGDGRYAVEVDADGAIRRCEFSLPGERLEPEARCAEAPRLTVSGISDGLSRVVVAGAPHKIGVSITVKGELVRHAELEPSYSVDRPNGQGCDPVCRVAEVTLSSAAAKR